MPMNQVPVSFSEKARADKPDIFKQQTQPTQEVATNPFARKEPATQNVEKKPEGSIFAELKASTAP